MNQSLIFPKFGSVAYAQKKNSDQIHFLHIGKCAGTQIKNIINQINEMTKKKNIIAYGHDTFLFDLPKNSRYFFSIRDPINRFVSGFYSRKRKGQPRLYAEWTADEEYAFKIFEDANDLAESLYDAGVVGAQALSAIMSIRHTARHQVEWFSRTGAFLTLNPPIWIVRQEKFNDELNVCLERAGYQHMIDQIKIEYDPVNMHSNNYKGVPELSEKAKSNLINWYSRDFEFYKMCVNWMSKTV